MNNEMTFGEYLSEKRKDRGITLKDLASDLGVTSVYLCDVEKNRKAAPRTELLYKIADILTLDKDERDNFYDLAANVQSYKKGISPDLPDYIMGSKIVRTALRTAMQYNIGEEEWRDFIRRIEEKYEK